MARARKVVSEKTLELNIAGSILERIRTNWAGCSSAFWLGMKQYQEAKNGIDELLQNMPSSRHLALQFKSPWATRINSAPYKYGMGEDQHARLSSLATRPNVVFYVFPHYNSFSRMRTDAPDLLQHTYFLDVHVTSGLGSTRYGKYVHKVSSDESTPPRIAIRSEPIDVPATAASTYFGDSADSFARDSLLTNGEVRSWLDEHAAPEGENPHAIGQRLRGFGTMCIP